MIFWLKVRVMMTWICRFHLEDLSGTLHHCFEVDLIMFGDLFGGGKVQHYCISAKQLPSLKLTPRTWKWMVGILKKVSLWLKAHFQVLSTVSFREGNGSIDIFLRKATPDSAWNPGGLPHICGCIKTSRKDLRTHTWWSNAWLGHAYIFFMYFHRSMHIVVSCGSQLWRFLFVLSDCEH